MRATRWQLRRGAIDLRARPTVMGVLNVTPDSFSDGGRYLATEAAVEHGLALLGQGADILDVGGESTRPGAEPVTIDDELARVIPVIEALRARSSAVISIDTSKARVAEAALRAGADIINDISGFAFEPEIASVAVEHGAGVVLMHTPGRPAEMMQRAEYRDVVADVASALAQRLEVAIAAGVERERVVLDPGFGFGKTPDQNYRLLAGLDRIVALGRPVLVGMSRKRMIRSAVGSDAAALEFGTAGANAVALTRGATIVRVHDVAAARASCDVAWRAIHADHHHADS